MKKDTIPTSADDAARYCGAFAEAQGYPRFLLSLRLPRPPAAPVQAILTNFSRSWLQVYEERDFASTDPVAQHVMSTATPVVWSELERSSKKACEFFEAAAEHGLKEGITVPWYGPQGEYALLSLTGADVPSDPVHRDRLMSDCWLFLARNFGSLRHAVLLSRRRPAKQRLTERQQKVLSMISNGLTMREIAQDMGVHVRTAEDALRRAMQRLRASSREQAIINAITLGQLEKAVYPDGVSRLKLVVLEA